MLKKYYQVIASNKAMTKVFTNEDQAVDYQLSLLESKDNVVAYIHYDSEVVLCDSDIAKRLYRATSKEVFNYKNDSLAYGVYTLSTGERYVYYVTDVDGRKVINFPSIKESYKLATPKLPGWYLSPDEKISIVGGLCYCNIDKYYVGFIRQF